MFKVKFVAKTPQTVGELAIGQTFVLKDGQFPYMIIDHARPEGFDKCALSMTTFRISYFSDDSKIKDVDCHVFEHVSCEGK